MQDDQPEFDAAYVAALEEAKASQDLTGLFTTLEAGRGVEVLQSDPEVSDRVPRRVAKRLAGNASPGNEPLSETRAKANT